MENNIIIIDSSNQIHNTQKDVILRTTGLNGYLVGDQITIFGATNISIGKIIAIDEDGSCIVRTKIDE